MQTIKDELHLTLLAMKQNEMETRTRTTSVGIEITDVEIGM